MAQPDFEGFWPQSGELTVGRENFTAINSYYPANGVWEFEVHSVVCDGETVVTDVSITDSVQKARAITFHTVENGLITKQKEFCLILWKHRSGEQNGLRSCRNNKFRT
ncbi:hypothetical protein JCM18904_4182 [Vibrio sp. JCM 18904]|nr:hypothetical protein JCM18904_4182 [Vibrio sp. JCM 18904]